MYPHGSACARYSSSERRALSKVGGQVRGWEFEQGRGRLKAGNKGKGTKGEFVERSLLRHSLQINLACAFRVRDPLPDLLAMGRPAALIDRTMKRIKLLLGE